MLAVTVFLTRQRVTMHIRNQDVGINCEFSLKGEWLQRFPKATDRTYVEDMKDPVEHYTPSGNRIFVVPCVDHSGE